VHNLLTVSYLTDYVFRGIDFSDFGGHEDTANLQIQGQLTFDLGSIQPFIGVFANVCNDDPISDFQEIRPFVGAEVRSTIRRSGRPPNRSSRRTFWPRTTMTRTMAGISRPASGMTSRSKAPASRSAPSRTWRM
jgi:hypothetical protein